MGVVRNFQTSIVGIIAAGDMPTDQRKDRIRFFRPTDSPNSESSSGYRALLCCDELRALRKFPTFIISENPII
jgi:hypothetical protein